MTTSLNLSAEYWIKKHFKAVHSIDTSFYSDPRVLQSLVSKCSYPNKLRTGDR